MPVVGVDTVGRSKRDSFLAEGEYENVEVVVFLLGDSASVGLQDDLFYLVRDCCDLGEHPGELRQLQLRGRGPDLARIREGEALTRGPDFSQRSRLNVPHQV